MISARSSDDTNASALVVAIEDYEHHPKLDDLGAFANDLAGVLEQAGFVDAFPLGRKGGKARELAERLQAWFAEASSERRLVLYWTGHGNPESQQFYLMTQDSPSGGFLATNSIETKFIAKLAALSKAKRILVVIDACYSGTAIGSVIAEIANVLNEQHPDAMQGRGIAVIASAHSLQKAQVGILPGLLKGALTNPFIPRRWSDSDQFIDGDRLTATLKDEVRRQGIEQRIVMATYEEAIELIPNPRYLAGLPAENVEERLWRLSRAGAAEHFKLAARGIEIGETGWFFSGRKRLLRALVDWLKTDEHGVRIVTGPPGAGKSAVMGRLATLSDAQYRQEAIDAGAVEEEYTMPPMGAIDVAIHAKGKTLDDLSRALAEGLGIEISQDISANAERLVKNVGRLDRRLILLMDAVDEAAEEQGAGIATRLITPLGFLPHVKVLVGTRRSLDGALNPKDEDRHGRLRKAFGPGAIIDDLEDEKETREDIAEYVRRRLQSSDKHHNDDPAIIQHVVERVAEKANGVFLYARIASRTLQDQDSLDGELPTTALDAFEQDLTIRFKGNEQRLNDLLGALAWGEGKGLTRRAWTLIANASAGRRSSYNDDDIAWVLNHAGWHIIEAGEDGQTVYRLAHQALADHYRGKVDKTEAQGQIVDALRKTLNGADWLDCDRYLWRYLADHAAKAGRLDDLIKDPGYLAVADPARLLIWLPSINSVEGTRFGSIYQRVVDRLVDMKPIERMPLIHLTAQMEDPELAPTLEPPVPTPWRCRWARLDPTSPHRVISKNDRPIQSIATGEIYGSPVIVLGNYGNILFRSARTGDLLGGSLGGYHPFVKSLAICEIDGVPTIVSGGTERTVQRWNARTGEPIGAPLEGHTNSIASVAVFEIDGVSMIISGSEDRTIRRWNARTGEPIGGPLERHTNSVASVAVFEIDGVPVIVSGSWDDTILRWNARTGEPIGEPLEGHTGSVASVAVCEIDGVPVIVSGSWDHTILRWNARTGEAIGSPLRRHTGSVNTIAFCEIDGAPMIISGSDDQTILLWSARTGEAIGSPLKRHTGSVNSIAICEIDGVPMIVSGGHDGALLFWNARISEAEGGPRVGHTGPADPVAICEIDEMSVIVSGNRGKTIRRWNACSGESVGAPLEGHTDWVRAIAIGEVDGEPTIISGSNDGAICRWNARTGEAIGWPLWAHRDPINSVILREIDGEPTIISGSSDRTIRRWNARTGGQIGLPLEGHNHSIASVAVCEIYGKPIIVSGSFDTTIRRWKASAGSRWLGRVASWTYSISPYWFSKAVEQIGAPLEGHTSAVESVAVCEIDGVPVIVSGSWDNTIRCWDARTGVLIGSPVENIRGSVYSVAVGNVGSVPIIISTSWDTIQLWDAREGKNRLLWEIAIGGRVRSVVTDGGTKIFVGLDRGLLMLEVFTVLQR